MSNTINIPEILKNNNIQPDFEGDAYYAAIVSSIKQAVGVVIDKCAEDADVITDEGDYGCTCMINRESILKVKKLVVYG